ncbi:MAG: hypothetical protein K5886_04335 [Lachnospiraceae bacterium]|nr:hypothetical protein [Lachnospiraceae bacterium]
MRVSLPPGTVLPGKRSEYEVIKFVCVSDRSISVICKDGQGRKYRLKLYDGVSGTDGELPEKCMQTVTDGVIRLIDTGSYQNCFFMICDNYPFKSLDRQTVPVQVIRSVLLPKILSVMHAFHEMQVVLRDIAPEHVLYDPASQSVYYSGFSNLLYLGKKAEFLRAPGYGQKGEYIAPEAESRGYGFASDYFSLGVMLLNVIKGKNAFEGISREAFYTGLKSGSVPGIDIGYLKKTPYDLYSAEDKLYYLILGLLIPDPDKRWEYGEVRCFLNDQHIPLVRKSGRIEYKYHTPFVINGISCFNDGMIAENLAKNAKELTGADLNRLYKFLGDQDNCAADLSLIPVTDSFRAKVFKLIYALDPAIDGFYWDGRRYTDTDDFAASIRVNPALLEELKEILKNDCFSYYASCRKKVGINVFSDASEIRGLEELEKSEPGTGANRCLMLFTGGKNRRSFRINGNDHTEISGLIADDPKTVSWLEKNCVQIMKNDSFRAWLWSRGLEKAADEAERSMERDPDSAFTVFLTVCEACADSDEDKKKIRKVFLKYGDLSPVVWLISNVKYYRVISPVNKDLHDRFLNARIDTGKSISQLHDRLSMMVGDYQLFVQKTAGNPFTAENGGSTDDSTGFVPMYESGYFCLRRKQGLEVCPAYLRAAGERIDRGEVDKWLDEALKNESSRLNRKLSALGPAFRPYRSVLMEDHKKKLILSAIVMLITLILAVGGFSVFGGIGIIAFAGTLIWFSVSLSTCYRDKAGLDIAAKESEDNESRRTSLTGKKNDLPRRKEEILQGIMNGKNIRCRT